jgi:acylphosphatase
MEKRLRAKVTGKVQMVMYRDFIQRKAKFLNLVGAVENQEDGSVVVIAEGEEASLNKLIPALHKGPFLARVRDVDINWSESKNEFTDFEIIY